MKLTKAQLKHLIREELVGVLEETNGYSGYTKAYGQSGKEIKAPGRRIKGRADVSKIKSAEKHAKKTGQGPIAGVEVSSLQQSLPVEKGSWETAISHAVDDPVVSADDDQSLSLKTARGEYGPEQTKVQESSMRNLEQIVRETMERLLT